MSFKAILLFLEALPIIGPSIRWIKSKRALFIQYVLLGLFVGVGGLAFALWLTKRELKADLAQTTAQLDTVKSRLTTVEFSNSVQKTTIDNLKELRELDSVTLGELINEFSTLSSKDSTVRKRLAELEKTNEAVRNLRNQPVPPELGCLLEPRACETRDPASTGR